MSDLDDFLTTVGTAPKRQEVFECKRLREVIWITPDEDGKRIEAPSPEFMECGSVIVAGATSGMGCTKCGQITRECDCHDNVRYFCRASICPRMTRSASDFSPR